jgi:hypothetical protein
MYSRGFTHLTQFDPEDGGIMFNRNIGNAAQTPSVRRPPQKIKEISILIKKFGAHKGENKKGLSEFA